MDWIKSTLEALKNAFEGEDMSFMVSFLKGSKKQTILQIISNFLPVCFIWFWRIAIIGCAYYFWYNCYPTSNQLLFLALLWLVISLGSTVSVSSGEWRRIAERQDNRRFKSMDKVALYHDKIKKSFSYSTVKRANTSYLDEEFIKESINFIEVILKRYEIDPLSFNIEIKDVENYLDSICIIKDFILSYELESANKVRIRYNENHKLD